MLVPSTPRATIAVNAQLLSTRHSYRSAGSSRYLLNLLRELRRIDGTEEILALVANDVEVAPDLTSTDRFHLTRSSWPTRRPTERILWEQVALPRLLRQHGARLLHGGGNALPLSWRGRSVVTILDLTFLLLPGAFRRGNRAYLRFMVRFAARRADRIITISESTRRDVIRMLGAAPERVVRVYCGVDERFHPAEDPRAIADFRARKGLPAEFVLYLGTIEPRKNLVRLIEAYAEIRRRGVTKLPLVLAGGRGWGDEVILRHARSVGFDDDIRFMGFVPEEEIPLWYNAATFFVYPSEYEGFGLPPLEALACGTPVVASNSSSLPEVLGDSAILVDPADTGAIAEGMQRMLEDEALRAHLKTAGLKQASTFSWRRMAEETMAVYRSVLSRS